MAAVFSQVAAVPTLQQMSHVNDEKCVDHLPQDPKVVFEGK